MINTISYHNISGKRAFTVLLLLFLSTGFLYSQRIAGTQTIVGTGTIEGTITDSSGNDAVSNAVIKLNSPMLNKSFETVSDATGKFRFENIPASVYSIKAVRLGYVSSNYSDVTVIENSTLVLNLQLSPVTIETDNINVTASKTELTLKQTPSSISIITLKDIQNKNSLTFDELLGDVQGVTVFKTSGINVQSLSIRGSSDVAGGGIGNRVLLLLDGRPSLTGDSKGALWSLIPISIIDRTEIVKGAFSSLYGSSAIGGVVNVITKKPTYNAFTSLNANYGFYQPLNDSLKFSDKLLSFRGVDLIHSNTYKKLAYLLNLNYKKNDGHAEQTDYEFYSGLGKFMYDVLSNRDLEVTLQYTRSNSAFPHYWRKDPGGPTQPYKTSPIYIGDRIKKETQSVDVFYTAVPNSKIKYTSRFYYYKLYSLSYFNPKNFVSQQFAPPGEALETTIRSYNFGNISQIDYRFSERNYFISGIDVQWNVVRSNPESILYGDQQMNNFGIFAQDQHKLIIDNSGHTILSATAGARLDYNKFVGLSQFMQLSPKLSFLYTPAVNGVFSNTAFRFLVGRAFRAPSIAELYFKKELFGGFDFIFNPALKPEEMISAEIGFRKQYDKKFTIDVSAYINEYDNLIQYVNVGGGVLGPFQVQNIAKAQIKGIEFEASYNSNLNLFKKTFGYGLNFNYSLVDARDLSTNRKDEFLPYKPKHLLNFGTDLSYQGFNLHVNGKFVSEVEEDLFYKYEEPEAYFLMDLKVSKKLFDNATIFAAVNNLLNTSYQELERTQAPNRSFNSGFRIEF